MLYKLLWNQAKIHGDKTAVAGEARSLTYVELLERASLMASHLQSQGCAVGDAIIIGVPPSPEFYAAFYGAAALGLVILPVLPSGQIPQLVAESKPKFAVGDKQFLTRASRYCPTLRKTVEYDASTGLRFDGGKLSFTRRRTFRDEYLMGVSSSGTTGTPSIYYRSQELVIRRAQFRAKALGITADDVLLAARPFNSGSSINSHVIMPLVAGCKIVVRERIRRFDAADAITRERVTVLYAVPFVFQLLASIPPDYPVDFSSLRLCISGSAPLADSVAQSFARRFGVEIRQRYGGSHIHPAFTYNLAGVSGAVGQTFGAFPIEILDENGNPQKTGRIGEIAFDYKNAARPWKKYLKTNPNRHGRYIFTGDLGKTDAQGNVFIVGRKSPFIKVHGNRVEPAEVEAVLRAHPAVEDAFVYSINPGKPDEAVGALVLAQAIDASELMRHCAERLDGYKCPRKITIHADLPRTPHGKLARKTIEEAVAKGAF